jgi:hypothetical protein
MFERFGAWTKENFVKLHESAYPHSSNSTKTSFFQTLKRIESIYGKPIEELDLIFLKDPNKLFQNIKESKYTDNTLTTTFTSILKMLKILDAPLSHYNNYVKVLSQHTKELIKKKRNFVASQDLPTWSQLQDFYFNYLPKDDFVAQRNYLLVGFFLLNPPVRISNYTRFKLLLNDEVPNDNNNYLMIIDKGVFLIFNKFRTSHIQGQRILEIKDEFLKQYIQAYLETYKIKNNQYILTKNEINNKALGQNDLNEILYTETLSIFGYSFTTQDLRTIYLRETFAEDASIREKIEIADIMGYKDYNNIFV